jgi:hypothetical protein
LPGGAAFAATKIAHLDHATRDTMAGTPIGPTSTATRGIQTDQIPKSTISAEISSSAPPLRAEIDRLEAALAGERAELKELKAAYFDDYRRGQRLRVKSP